MDIFIQGVIVHHVSMNVCGGCVLKKYFYINKTHALNYYTHIKNVKRLTALCLRKISLKFIRFVVCVYV